MSPTRSRRESVQRARATRLGRLAESETSLLVSLLLLGAVLTALVMVYPRVWPMSTLVLPLTMGSLWLSPRVLPWFVVTVMGFTVLGLARQGPDVPLSALVTRVGTVFALALLILIVSFRRSRLGVGGMRGEEMFVDLRDRINRQGSLPPLPDDWFLEYAHRSAGGTPFSGDFAVGFRKGDLVQLAVVDVSGKGSEAGTRALLLSGAMGGLMGALPAGRFLAESNDYLCRQEWSEGFATAIHLVMDLRTGIFELRTAGHPPGVHLVSGSGRWLVRETEGPVLGLLEGVEFEPFHGRIDRGDVVLLYTDGLVETSSRELALGIDRLLGTAEKELHGELEGRADRLVNLLGSRDDDAALLLLHRR